MRRAPTRFAMPLIAIFAVALLPAAALGQPSGWMAPRTADGHPDLQGVWGNNAVTPLERPESLGERATLSDEELAQVQETAEELFALDAGDAAFGDQFFNTALTAPETFTSSDGGTGNYNQFWLVERDFNNRTSLITDPPSGRLPELTDEAQQAADATRAKRGQPAAWTDDRGLSERCITFGLPNLLAGYNSYYHIFQTADHVVIEQELIHTTRIIPLDGRPHVGAGIHQWHGNSVGRWEGDTLVVETKNFSPRSNSAARATGCTWSSGSRGSAPTTCTTSSPSTTPPSGTAPGPRCWSGSGPTTPSSSTPATRGTSAWRASSPAPAPTTRRLPPPAASGDTMPESPHRVR